MASAADIELFSLICRDAGRRLSPAKKGYRFFRECYVKSNSVPNVFMFRVVASVGRTSI